MEELFMANKIIQNDIKNIQISLKGYWMKSVLKYWLSILELI